MNYDLFLILIIFFFGLFVEPLGLPLFHFALELSVAAGEEDRVSAAADVEGRALVALDVDAAVTRARDDAEADFFFVSLRPEIDFFVWRGKSGV